MSQIVELIRGLGTPFDMVATVCLIFALAGIVGAGAAMIAAIAKEIRKYACHRQELEFKRELLDRGMAVDEVERLVGVREEQRKSG